MGRLCIKGTHYKHKEYDRRLKEQFINGLDDKKNSRDYKRTDNLEKIPVR